MREFKNTDSTPYALIKHYADKQKQHLKYFLL